LRRTRWRAVEQQPLIHTCVRIVAALSGEAAHRVCLLA
jgi:hypothetical protein